MSLKSDFLPLLGLLAPDGPLLVDVLHDTEGVRGQEVIHLVAQSCLTKKFGSPHEVT